MLKGYTITTPKDVAFPFKFTMHENKTLLKQNKSRRDMFGGYGNDKVKDLKVGEVVEVVGTASRMGHSYLLLADNSFFVGKLSDSRPYVDKEAIAESKEWVDTFVEKEKKEKNKKALVVWGVVALIGGVILYKVIKK